MVIRKFSKFEACKSVNALGKCPVFIRVINPIKIEKTIIIGPIIPIMSTRRLRPAITVITQVVAIITAPILGVML